MILIPKVSRWGNVLVCYVSKCLWPAIGSVRTGWLLGLDKDSLRLVIGFITGHCEIMTLTGFWNRYQPEYCRVCCDKKELETILLCDCPALSKLGLRTLGGGYFEGLNLNEIGCIGSFCNTSV